MFNLLNRKNPALSQQELEQQMQMQQQMEMQTKLDQMLFQERLNAGTSKTNNEEFDKNGYLFVKDLYDPNELITDVPKERGILHYYGSLDKFSHNPEELQVNGSVARYYYPAYKYAHSQIRLKIEKIIGKKLFNTYYYDRFYFPGQNLFPHVDRNACEISVTLHIRTNLKTPWPIWIKTPDTYNDETKSEILERGKEKSLILEAGDGMIYKGCERPHWRESMPSDSTIIETSNSKKNFIKNIFSGNKNVPDFNSNQEEIFYHQVFFHYVIADGVRSHCAGDMSN